MLTFLLSITADNSNKRWFKNSRGATREHKGQVHSQKTTASGRPGHEEILAARAGWLAGKFARTVRRSRTMEFRPETSR